MTNANKSAPRPLIFPKLMALGLAAMLIGGCGLAKRDYPEKRYYNLGLEAAEPGPSPKRPGLLLLGEMRVSSLLQRPNLIYKVGENEIKSDFYNEFATPVGRLWQEALSVYLSEHGPINDVGLTSSLKAADWMLNGFLITHQADLTGPVPQAEVRLQLTVIDLKRTPRPVILNKTYHQRRELNDALPETVAQGLNLLMADIFKEFNKDLRQVLLH